MRTWVAVYTERKFSLFRLGTYKAKTTAWLNRTFVREPHVSAGDFAVVSRIEPAATAQDASITTLKAIERSASSYHNHTFIVALVPAPFPYVPAHVVQAQRIGRHFLYLVSLEAAVSAIPCKTFYVTVSAVGGLPAVADVAATRKVFPLRFGWQAVAVGRKVAGYGSAYVVPPLVCVRISVHFIAGC